MMRKSPFRAACFGAILTVLTLLGGLLAGVILGNLVFGALPGHLNDPLRITLSAIPAIAGISLGSAVWGVLMGQLAHGTEIRRMGWAGILGFVPVTIILGILLQILEPIALERLGTMIPLHRLFTLLFVPTAFLIASIGSAAVSIGLRQSQAAGRLAFRTGLAAAIAFLAINLGMASYGWEVGAPGAADRFTMLTVMFVSNLGAALAGGASMGFMLNQGLRPQDI